MKGIVILALLLIGFPGFFSQLKAQEITYSNYNGFTGEHEIETSIVSLKGGFSTGFGVAIRSHNSNLFLSFIGYGKKGKAIRENDRLQFILNDGSVIKFDSRVQLPSNESGVPNLYINHYYISKLEVQALTKNPVVIVRRISATGHSDLPVPKKNANSLVKLCKLFLKEMNKF